MVLIFFFLKEKSNLTTGKEMSWYRQQQNQATALQIVQCIRLWFMPGVEEVSLELVPQTAEVRFGLDIKRTEEVNRVADFLSLVLSLRHFIKHVTPA